MARHASTLPSGPLAEARLAGVLDASFFGGVSAAAREPALRGARLLEHDAGARYVAPGLERRAGLVVSGLVRVYVSALDGRELTTRYSGAGALVGIVSALAYDRSVVGVQALTPSVVLDINPSLLESAARSHPDLKWALGVEISTRLRETMDLCALNAFGTLRRRIARHVLLVAALTDGQLVPLTQQQLADCVGTIRESVARVLGQFQRQGLVQRLPAGLIVTNERRLTSVAAGQESDAEDA